MKRKKQITFSELDDPVASSIDEKNIYNECKCQVRVFCFWGNLFFAITLS